MKQLHTSPTNQEILEADLRGDFIVLMRKKDTKMKTLVTMEPFLQLSVQ